jgi:hypothetical protein
MITNVGTLDRIVRIALAIVCSVLYFTGVVTGTWGIVLLVAGGVLLLTALVGICGLYMMLGVRTCPVPRK